MAKVAPEESVSKEQMATSLTKKSPETSSKPKRNVETLQQTPSVRLKDYNPYITKKIVGKVESYVRPAVSSIIAWSTICILVPAVLVIMSSEDGAIHDELRRQNDSVDKIYIASIIWLVLQILAIITGMYTFLYSKYRKDESRKQLEESIKRIALGFCLSSVCFLGTFIMAIIVVVFLADLEKDVRGGESNIIFWLRVITIIYISIGAPILLIVIYCMWFFDVVEIIKPKDTDGEKREIEELLARG